MVVWFCSSLNQQVLIQKSMFFVFASKWVKLEVKMLSDSWLLLLFRNHYSLLKIYFIFNIFLGFTLGKFLKADKY